MAARSRHEQASAKQLLLLRHAERCESNSCSVHECAHLKRLLEHMKTCQHDVSMCSPECCSSRKLITHFQGCQDEICPVCEPTREAIQRCEPAIPSEASCSPSTKAEIRALMAERLLEVWKVSQVCQGCPVMSKLYVPTKDMLSLWEHVSVCKIPKCDVRHCISTRFVIAHHIQCVDAACTICRPVRQNVIARDAHLDASLLVNLAGGNLGMRKEHSNSSTSHKKPVPPVPLFRE